MCGRDLYGGRLGRSTRMGGVNQVLVPKGTKTVKHLIPQHYGPENVLGACGPELCGREERPVLLGEPSDARCARQHGGGYSGSIILEQKDEVLVKKSKELAVAPVYQSISKSGRVG